MRKLKDWWWEGHDSLVYDYPNTWTNWRPDAPHVAGPSRQTCIRMQTNGQWYGSQCREKLKCLCQGGKLMQWMRIQSRRQLNNLTRCTHT